MKTRWNRYPLAILLALLAAMTLSPARPTHANGTSDPPPHGGWFSFDKSAIPAPPSLSLEEVRDGTLTLWALFPGCWFEPVTFEGSSYTRLSGEGYGKARTIGYPDLPILRREVEIPSGATVTPEILSAEYTDYTLTELGFAPILPLQPSRPKRSVDEEPPFAIDRGFYARGNLFPSTPLALGQPYTVRGHYIQPIELSPVAYDPASGTLRVYSRLDLRLHLSEGDPAATRAAARRYAAPLFERQLARRLLNYETYRPEANTATTGGDVGYLIVTADPFYDAMLPFVDLKEQQGFTVTMKRLSEVPGGATREDIQSYVRSLYTQAAIPPSYLLLVGDTNLLPGWPSQSAHQVTDLYYATLDGAGDWHPDIGRGRFPVRTVTQTTALVNKYLAYEALKGGETWLKRPAFISTCDDKWDVAEGSHNYVITNYTAPQNYGGSFPNAPQPGGDRLYCVSYEATEDDIRDALNEGRWGAIYSGHGSYAGWELYDADDVRAQTSLGVFPFVASYACLTGNFGRAEVFGETWLVQEDKGALVFWGSSDDSYWDEDDILERASFDALFASPYDQVDVTEMLYQGLASVEANYAVKARYYWETYNLLGDPAFKIFTEAHRPTFSLNVDPAEQALCQSGVISSTVTVESHAGYSGTVTLKLSTIPQGVTVTLKPLSATAPFTSRLALNVAPTAPRGKKNLTITATADYVTPRLKNLSYWIQTDVPGTITQTSPVDSAVTQPLYASMAWAPHPQALTYQLQVEENPYFRTPLLDTTTATTTYRVETPLEGGQCYWWRVRGVNACGAAPWEPAQHFATEARVLHFEDGMEEGDAAWAHGAGQGDDNWELLPNGGHAAPGTWHVPNAGTLTDSYLQFQEPIPLERGGTLTFWHRHFFEGDGFDGGVLEVSTDGGETWQDLGGEIVANGYTGTIGNRYGNPLGGRQGWIGDLGVWTQVEVDLNAFTGKEVLVRWRIGSDSSVPDEGWYVDDVRLLGHKPTYPAPALREVQPPSAESATPVPVVIQGENFSKVSALRLGETWLPSVTVASSTTLETVIPANLAGGSYTLTLYSGDCTAAVLPHAFFVGTCVTPSLAINHQETTLVYRPVPFTATVMTGTEPLDYLWDFGGPGYGKDLNTAAPVYTYTTPGTFTPTLTIIDPCGNAVTRSGSIDIGCDPVEADFDVPEMVETMDALRLTATTTGTSPFTYTWSFGGAGRGSGVDSGTPVYTYTEPGPHTVALTVTNACGRHEVRRRLFVYQPLASVEIEGAHSLPVNTTAHFTAHVRPITATSPITLIWNNGSVGPVAAYRWSKPGTYTLTATAEGPFNSARAARHVHVYWPLEVADLMSNAPVEPGYPVHLTATVLGMPPITYAWDFGGAGYGSGLEGPTPTYTYATAGRYVVQLWVNHPYPGEARRTMIVYVGLQPLYLPLIVKNPG